VGKCSLALLFRFLGLVCWLSATFAQPTPSFAQGESLPPRSEWRASSSSTELPGLAPKFAIDRDHATKWGGPFTAGHWVQVDLGRAANLGGVVLHWDNAFAVTYFIQASTDGSQWQTVYESVDSAGTTDYIFFPAIRSRYLRLSAVPRTADWGVNLYEIEPLAAREIPAVDGLTQGSDPARIWSLGWSHPLVKSGPEHGTRELRLNLARLTPLAGIEVYWGGARASARLEARDTNGNWQVVANDPEALGDTSYLAAREARAMRELRLIVTPRDHSVPAVARLRLLSPMRVMTSIKRYEIAASRAHGELFPESLHAQQVYWTVVGVPAGKQKSIFDEYGHTEAFKGAPLVQPLWRDDTGRVAAASNAALTHRLRDGWMPMPSVEWEPQAGLKMRSETFAVEHADQPVTLVRHRLENTGVTRVKGQLAMLVRPIQINPRWQNGGLAPIHEIAIQGPSAQTSVAVNGRVLLHSLTAVDARGAAPFGEHGETEITRHAVAGTAPVDSTARDPDGLAAAVLSYRVDLAPGATRDVVLAFPLGTERLDATLSRLPERNSTNDPGAAFDALGSEVAEHWRQRFGHIGITLPDASLVDMLRAQAAYMLLNQTGHAMQPGPRNYSRSFIRDGSATAAVLVRMGHSQVARDYLRWYADHAVQPNGLVSPILDDDGTVNRGFGSDIEYDSQGQFIWLVAEIARLDGGAASVREYEAKVKRAMQFMQTLRERTLVPGYASDRPAPERFRGIIAPSISHEGYSTPTHSYWDDYWSLKGWHDGAWLAESWGDRDTAAWAREQYRVLREAMANSIRATMAWRRGDFIPTDADTGNGDPTSVSIALDPTGQGELLPRDALERTFSRYLDEVRRRDVPNALYAYTPYELRNILTFVHLNQPQHADELLRSYLRHRRPLEWQVFAEVVQSRLRYPIYLGDMPHTWIGAEYARALFGMLLREEDARLLLLPGAPESWLAGEGLSVTGLPTAFGRLTMRARQQNGSLRVSLDAGLKQDSRLYVAWPNRQKPMQVEVDGRAINQFNADGVAIDRPFRELLARW
jgi:F5/8 type C domain